MLYWSFLPSREGSHPELIQEYSSQTTHFQHAPAKTAEVTDAFLRCRG
jgi:hypothetical protein